MGKRFQNATALEKAISLVLLLVIVVDVAIIVFGRAEDAPRTGTSRNEPARATTGAPASTAETTASTAETTASTDEADTTPTGDDGGIPPCAEVENPGPSDDQI